MDNKLYTLRDACDVLRVKPHVVTYLLSTKQIPEPLRLGGRRLFKMQDLVRISEALKLTVKFGEEGNAR